MQDKPTEAASAAIPVKEAPPEMPHSKLDSSSFKTPEEIANSDKGDEPDDSVKPHVEPGDAKSHGPKKSPIAKLKDKWASLTKKQKIIVAAVAVVLVFGIGGTAFALLNHKPAPKPVAKVAPKKVVPPPPAPTTVASNLTGLPVTPDVNQRPVTGVMIENSPDARPQSSLDQAGIVFEAVAEGGITRFLALFQDSQPDYIGPVRSARPYYLQWCLAFDCALAHAGGSPEALNDIPAWGVKNLDEFANAGAFQRISSRVAPHNLYTSINQLNSLEAGKNYGAAKFTSFPRKLDTPSKTINANVINLSISSAFYNVQYQYDSTVDHYVRSEGGVRHQQVNGAGAPNQIAPKVVIALVMQQGIEADDQHTSYTTLGSGKAMVFQDGTVQEGTWHKADNPGALTILDTNNQPLKLNTGQTWITVVGNANDITYNP